MKKFVNIFNLFLLTIFCIPLYLIKVDFLLFPTNIIEIFCISIIIITLIAEQNRLIYTIPKLPKILCIGVLLIIFGALLSILTNNINLSSFGIVKSWFIIPILFSFSLFLTIKTKVDVEKIFASVYSSAVFIACISIIYKLIGNVTYDNRLSSFYLSPNYLAMYLSSGIFFGFYFLIKNLSEREKYVDIAFHVFLNTLICIPIYYTYSYASWLALLISLTIMLLIMHKHTKHYFIIIGFLSCIVIIIVSSQVHSAKFLNLLNNYSQSSLSSRQMIWKSAFFLIQEKPILGIGPGNFQEAYLSIQNKYPPYLDWAVPQPHNVFLAFWLQTGILGLLGFITILVYVFNQLFILIQKQKKEVAISTTLFCFFLYTVLHGMADTTYWKNDLSLLFWIAISVYLSINSISKTKDY